jgi:hypothetical protein
MAGLMSRWLAALALLGGLRVLLGAVALPFFSPVDEAAHWDLVGKYARGAWPIRGADTFDPEVVESLARASPEFLMPRSWGAAPPPAWNADGAGPPVNLVPLRRPVNYEAFSPPVYYVVAAAWYRLGASLGMQGMTLFYWARFLNVPIYVFLVLAGYFYCRRFYPNRPWLAWSVPLLLAAFPQDVFFTLNSDVLSPLVGVLAMGGLLEWSRREPGAPADAPLGVLAGLLCAVAFLIK